MSVKATFWAWEQEAPSSSAKLVLLCLAECHNSETGLCFPSAKYISKMTGLNTKTIYRAAQDLDHGGFLALKTRIGASNNYQLNLTQKGGAPKTGQGVTQKRGKGVTQKRGTNQELNQELNLKTVPAEPKMGARQLPDDWVPSEKTLQRAIDLGYSFPDFPGVVMEFKDYWTNNKKRKKDWEQTFMNHLKFEWAKQQNGSNRYGKPKTASQILADDLDKTFTTRPGP